MVSKTFPLMSYYMSSEEVRNNCKIFQLIIKLIYKSIWRWFLEIFTAPTIRLIYKYGKCVQRWGWHIFLSISNIPLGHSGIIKRNKSIFPVIEHFVNQLFVLYKTKWIIIIIIISRIYITKQMKKNAVMS